MPFIQLKSGRQKKFFVSDDDWKMMQKNIIPGTDGDGGKGRPFASLYTVLDSRSSAEKQGMIPQELRSSALKDNSLSAQQQDAARKRGDKRQNDPTN